jgi:hypothetical protein
LTFDIVLFIEMLGVHKCLLEKLLKYHHTLVILVPVVLVSRRVVFQHLIWLLTGNNRSFLNYSIFFVLSAFTRIWIVDESDEVMVLAECKLCKKSFHW